MNNEYSIVNQRLPRKDSYDKATGAAKYIDDYYYPDMLYGGAVQSKIPHARIKSVNTKEQSACRE